MSAVRNVIPLDVAIDDLVCVDPGEYPVVYVRHIGVIVFRTAKIRVDFRLLPYPGLIVSRWYRVKGFRGGRIQAGRHSDIVREMSAVLGRRIRHDRIPVSSLENIAMRAVVREVVADRNQVALAPVNRYTVISRILEG
jgi:hypothetical protein